MKHLLVLCTLWLLYSPAEAQSAKKLVIDTIRSKLWWTGYAETGAYSPTGTVNVDKGYIMLKGNIIISGTIIVNMQTLKHENPRLEAHLKNEDFFNVSVYPTAVFDLISVINGTATGRLTIKSKTRLIKFPIRLTQFDKEYFIEAKLRIDRTLFGINYNSVSFFQNLGSYAIKNYFDLTIKLVAHQ